MSKYNGGPAFARPKSPKGEYTDSKVPDAQTGMSLRDYFAARAMQIFEADSYTNVDWLAGKAYEVADAMLRERAK